MVAIHRETDSRVCGAGTVVVGQDNVYANGLLVAVDGDPNSHGGGALVAGCKQLFVNSIMVVNHSPDGAAPDALCPIAPHCAPITAQGSLDVFIGDA